MKLFNKNELKLAILYCLEQKETKNLWKEVMKITQKPSFFQFIYFMHQIKNSKLYTELNLHIKIKKSSKFYNMFFKHLIKNDYIIINNKLPITNEKISHIIKRWKISKKLVKELAEKIKFTKIKQNEEYNQKMNKDATIFLYMLFLFYIIYSFIVIQYFF
jgi:hypothetical protein